MQDTGGNATVTTNQAGTNGAAERIMGMMNARLTASALSAALLFSAGAPARAAVPHPKPSASPLRTIEHVYSSRLCGVLGRAVAPAVGRILQNDHTIARSRPLFQDYTLNQSTKSQAGTDMDVERLSGLVDPLVRNTREVERLLNDPEFAHRASDKNDKQIQQMRAELAQILGQQKKALDLVSGFVDTEELGELQAAGHEYDRSLNSTLATNKSDPANTPASGAPTPAPQNILNAGVSGKGVARKNDPRYMNTGSTLGYNPLSAFDQQMENYQLQIGRTESVLTAALYNVIPQCGGHVPAPPAPAPLTPSAPAAPSPHPSGKP